MRWLLTSALLAAAGCGSARAPVPATKRPVSVALPAATRAPAPRTAPAKPPRLEQPEAPLALRETASLLTNVCQLGALPKLDAEQHDSGEPRFGCVCCAPFADCAPGEAPQESVDSVFWPSWSLAGSFSRAGAEQRVLAMAGCESHAAGYGGLVLLGRRGDRFVMERYYGGVFPRECRAFRRDDGRDLLVCRHEDGHMGHAIESIFQWELPDHDIDFDQVEPLLDLDDASPAGCFGELQASVTSQRIRKLEYVQAAGKTELVIDVDVRQGKVTAEYLKRCEEADSAAAASDQPDDARAPVNLLRSRMQRHRFRFDGMRFVAR